MKNILSLILNLALIFSVCKYAYSYQIVTHLINTTDPDGNVTQYQYDKESNVITRITANGDSINYAYDVLDRLTGKTTPEQIYSFDYDVDGNLISANNGIGSLEFGYDLNDNLIEVDTTYSSGLSATLNYAYDTANRLVSRTDPTGNTSYIYDLVNRLTNITDPQNNQFNFEYDNAGRRTRVTGSGGIEKTYDFDNANRLLSLINKVNGNNLETIDYEYDKAGNVIQKTNNEGVHDYAYDAVYRILSASQENETFEYDLTGNRTQDATQSYAHNSINQIISGTSNLSLNYDNSGNVTTKTDNGITWTYTWDSENHLTRAESSDGKVITYQYDAFSRRIARAYNGSTTNWVYDGRDIVLEYIDGVLSSHYTHGPNTDEPLVKTDLAESKNYYYHADKLGSITAITDTAGSIVETYDYSVYGIPTIRDNQEIVIDQSSIGNRYLFTGREFDSITGFYYHRARYRDPNLGIWLSKDPAEFVDGPNLYQYANSNPINYIDPSGENWIVLIVRLVGIAIAVYGVTKAARSCEREWDEGLEEDKKNKEASEDIMNDPNDEDAWSRFEGSRRNTVKHGARAAGHATDAVVKAGKAVTKQGSKGK